MTLKELRYFPIVSALPFPLVTSVGVLKTKKGFILAATNDKGVTYFGEAAPLPIFSDETIAETETSLNYICEFFERKPFSDFSDILNLNISPSVRFALESVFIQFAYANNPSTGLFEELSFVNEIKVNAIIGANTDNFRQTAETLISQGFETIKLKIGAEEFGKDLDKIKLLNDISGGKAKLRIDVNGKWNFREAEKKLSKLENLNIEYVEEPVRDASKIISLAKDSPVPLAFDESLKSFDHAFNLLTNREVKRFVIKPSKLGGLIRLFEFIKSAERVGKFVIISSSLETVVGKSVLAFAAAAVNRGLAHGLGVTSEFSDANISDPFPIANGKIKIDNFPADFSELQTR